MAKSRSQIQREYRERKKLKEGKAYLKKESSRVLKYYVPAEKLSDKERKKRNERAKTHNQTYRRRQKFQEANQNESASSGYDSVGSPLVVKLPLAGRSKGGKKKNIRALARAHGALNRLKVEKDKLYKKLRAKSRQLQRLQAKFSTTPSVPSTPNGKTENELRELNLTPRRREKVKRKLILKNVLLHEISEARASTSSRIEKQSIARLISGKLSRKYRLNCALNKGTGISRKTLSKTKSKKVFPDRRIRAVKQLQLDIENFLSREDNSRTQPGKADAVKVSNGEKKQTMILTNYLSDLHQKFIAENPNVKLSLATFCRLRPRNILPARFISRSSCLCIKHQNMSLKCQTLKKYSIVSSENPEHLIDKSADVEKAMSDTLPNEVSYRVWKQILVEDKKKMKVVEKTVNKNEFINTVKQELDQFICHVERVKSQYKEIKTLKENLPKDEVLVQMDFAENYTCKSHAEVQSAYWNQTPVTLHPVVIYYQGQNNKLEHKSIVVVSDELSHSTSTVCTFLDSLIPQIKEICPNVRYLHYWTDSPSSQYRNKTIFDLVAKHRNLYGVSARWNYFESGHGKGPCDGLGGTVKRMADEAVRRGAVVIQDSKEFFDWAVNSSMKEVKFLFVGKEECRKKLEELKLMNLKPLKGTMKLHAIAYDSKTFELCTRETSCYCDTCIKGEVCEQWTRHLYLNINAHEIEGMDTDEVSPSESQEGYKDDTSQNIIVLEISVEDYVVCVYDGKWYIGKILDIDEEDVQVTFMEKAKAMYKWPLTPDVIWCDKANVIYKIDNLEPSGKSERFWKLKADDRNQIQENFLAHRDN